MAKQGGSVYAILLLLIVAGTMTPRVASFDLFPGIFQCWKAVIEVENCVVKLVPSFLNLHIGLSQDCCKAIIHIEESCVLAVFPSPVFGAALSNITTSLCGALAHPSSQPIAP
ncbi:hypothetical protein KSP39_PZI013754 [Platanthera zijinensis]|uniref:Prolamin-like domain-containing protein n=1 Tax=Platanthera zijinensis TaxID=2320716 RepID=A0AAP0BEK8_9ASPA